VSDTRQPDKDLPGPTLDHPGDIRSFVDDSRNRWGLPSKEVYCTDNDCDVTLIGQVFKGQSSITCHGCNTCYPVKF